MALTKQDKKDITQIVNDVVDVKVTKEIGFLRLEMNQRFDDTNQKIDNVEGNILTKVEEIKTMENQDILALNDDVVRIKKKVGIR